jgi:hypothetical protein
LSGVVVQYLLDDEADEASHQQEHEEFLHVPSIRGGESCDTRGLAPRDIYPVGMRSFMLVVVVVLTACSGAAQTPPTAEPSTTTTATTTPLAESTTTTAESTTSTTEPVDPYAFDIVIEGSTVTGGGRISVPLGETVTLRFTSDIKDEIHIHGYELTLALEAGVTAEIRFLADIPGIVEIETHRNHQVVANLESS